MIEKITVLFSISENVKSQYILSLSSSLVHKLTGLLTQRFSLNLILNIYIQIPI
jgi:hypothetical protein